MLFLTVDNSSATKATKSTLVTKFGGNDSNIRDFVKDNPFKNASVSDIKEIVCLAHAHTKEIGNYTAQAFVKKFVSDFENRFKGKELKNQVEDIYLVGCEVGLTKDGTSLAQNIADLLYDKGFVNVKIHAAASPVDVKPEGMRVKVINKPNPNQVKKGITKGAVISYWLTEQQEKLMSKIEAMKEKYQTEEDEQDGTSLSKEQPKKEKPKVTHAEHKERMKLLEQEIALLDEMHLNEQYLFVTNDIEKELKRPVHTFVPKAPKVPAEKVQALAYLRRQLIHLNKKQDEEKNDLVRRLKTEVEDTPNSPVDAWKKPIIAELKGRDIADRALDMKSTTRKLLEYLRDSKHSKIEELFAKRDGKKNKKAEKENKKTKHKAIPEKGSKEEQEPLIAEEPSVVAPAPQPVITPAPRPVPVQRVVAPRQEERVDSDAEKAKEKLHRYINVLRQEAKQRCCISFFGHLGKYKLTKFQELETRVKEIDNVAEIQNEVRKLYKSSWFLTSGGSHRAKNLITNFLHGDFSRGIEDPSNPDLTREDLSIKTKAS